MADSVRPQSGAQRNRIGKGDGGRRWETEGPGNEGRTLPCDYPVNVLPTKL